MRSKKLGFCAESVICRQSELQNLSLPLVKTGANCKIELTYRIVCTEAKIDKKMNTIIQNDVLKVGHELQPEFNSFRPIVPGTNASCGYYDIPNTTFKLILLSARKHGLARFTFDPIRIDRERQSVELLVNNDYRAWVT